MSEPTIRTPLPALPAHYRAGVRRDRKNGHLKQHDARTLMSLCDLAERHGRLIPDITKTTVFMGLGELRPALADPTDGDGDWFFVHEVLQITGATPEQWFKLRDEEIEESRQEPPTPPRVDEYTVHAADGSTHQVPVCNWQMALGLALDGPWGKELMDNALPAMRRAAVETGLADSFPVVRLDENGVARETGETLADIIRADGPLPSAEVARQQIANGPLGAFNLGQDGGGHV